jgi:hypothetical protein
MALLSSVTMSSKEYIPAVNPVTDVEAEIGLPIVPAAGPVILVQLYPVIDPSGSTEPVPSSVIEFTGNLMLWSVPAWATGSVLSGG